MLSAAAAQVCTALRYGAVWLGVERCGYGAVWGGASWSGAGRGGAGRGGGGESRGAAVCWWRGCNQDKRSDKLPDKNLASYFRSVLWGGTRKPTIFPSPVAEANRLLCSGIDSDCSSDEGSTDGSDELCAVIKEVLSRAELPHSQESTGYGRIHYPTRHVCRHEDYYSTEAKKKRKTPNYCAVVQ